jgi:hypothetical protein
MRARYQGTRTDAYAIDFSLAVRSDMTIGDLDVRSDLDLDDGLRMIDTRSAVISLAMWTAIQIAVLVRYAPPEASGAGAPATEFSAARAYRALETLLDGVGPHPSASEANTLVRERLLRALSDRGWQAEAVTARGCGYGRCMDVTNVLARLPGRERGSVVLLAAHYDSVPEGPGASDDGVGVAALLEIARVVAREPATEHEIALLFTDGEELGLLGADAFADSHPLFARVRAVVNVEARGTSGPSLLFRTHPGALPILRAWGREAPRPMTNSTAGTVFSMLPNDTDLSVFLRERRLGLDFALIGDPLRYHTAEDDLAHVDRRSLQHSGDNALAAARALSRGPIARGDDAVWSDVLALFVLAIDVSWARVLAVVGVLGALFFAARRLGRGVFLGALAWIVAPVLALVLGMVLGVVLHPMTWLPEPLPWIVAAHGCGFAAVAVTALGVRRQDPDQAAAGAILAQASSGAALAFALPGVSYLLAWPALVAVVVLAIAELLAWRGEQVLAASLRRAAPLASSAVSALFVLPLCAFLYDALGGAGLAGIATLVALGLAPLGSLLTSARRS